MANTVDVKQIIEVMKNHRSIRAYQKKAIPSDIVQEIMTVSQRASTSSNIQAYSIIKVDDAQKRKTIYEVTGNQQHVLNAPLFFVFCCDLSRLKLVGKLNDFEFNTDHIESFLIGTVDATLAAQNMLVAAEFHGLGGVYIGAIRNDMERVKDLLNLPPYVAPLFGMCLGYPAEEPDVKPRLPLKTVFHQDSYDADTAEADIREYDKLMRDYYQTRSFNKRDADWSVDIETKFKTPRRTNIKDVLLKQKFGLD